MYRLPLERGGHWDRFVHVYFDATMQGDSTQQGLVPFLKIKLHNRRIQFLYNTHHSGQHNIYAPSLQADVWCTIFCFNALKPASTQRYMHDCCRHTLGNQHAYDIHAYFTPTSKLTMINTTVIASGVNTSLIHTQKSPYTYTGTYRLWFDIYKVYTTTSATCKHLE